jgi:hypothetical protein
MSNPVIIWDIDDVWHPWYSIAHQASVDFGLAHEGTPMPTTWSPHEEYGCTLEQWVSALDAWTLDGRLHASTPQDDDLQVFAELYVAGCDHHFVTARGFMGEYADVIRVLTHDWCDRHFGALYESLTFSRDKGATARELHATHAIDDNIGNYLSLEEAGVEVYLMDQPWNQDAPSHVRRVKSITEFGAAIEKGLSQ